MSGTILLDQICLISDIKVLHMLTNSTVVTGCWRIVLLFGCFQSFVHLLCITTAMCANMNTERCRCKVQVGAANSFLSQNHCYKLWLYIDKLQYVTFSDTDDAAAAPASTLPPLKFLAVATAREPHQLCCKSMQ